MLFDMDVVEADIPSWKKNLRQVTIRVGRGRTVLAEHVAENEAALDDAERERTALMQKQQRTWRQERFRRGLALENPSPQGSFSRRGIRRGRGGS